MFVSTTNRIGLKSIANFLVFEGLHALPYTISTTSLEIKPVRSLHPGSENANFNLGAQRRKGRC